MEKRPKPDQPVCIVLLSGGMDSAVLLADAIRRFGTKRVIALTVDYGQEHGPAEGRAAERIAEFYCVQHVKTTVDLSWLRSSILGTGDSDVVPGRNGILMALGAALADSLGGGGVWIGCNKDDANDFPDCGAGYVGFFARAVELGTVNPVTTRAPFTRLTKRDVYAKGRELGVPMAWTVSCYHGNECGECLACQKRKEAMA